MDRKEKDAKAVVDYSDTQIKKILRKKTPNAKNFSIKV